MKTYKSSTLTHHRAEVMREAENNSVIIQECRTNGEVIKEFVIVAKACFDEMDKICDVLEKKGEPIYYKCVCECFSLDDAQVICIMLNDEDF